MNDQMGFISEHLSATGNAPDRLLQILCETQQQYSYIPAKIVTQLSSYLHIPYSQIYGLIDFYRFLHRQPRGDFDILFSNNITDLMLGNQVLFTQLCKNLGVTGGIPRADGRVTVDLTSCTGLCDQGPAFWLMGLPCPDLMIHEYRLLAILSNSQRPLTNGQYHCFL